MTIPYPAEAKVNVGYCEPYSIQLVHSVSFFLHGAFLLVILTHTVKAVALISSFTTTIIGAFSVDAVSSFVAAIFGGIVAFVDI